MLATPLLRAQSAPGHRALKHLVFERRYAQWSGLSVALRNVGSSHRGSPIGARLGSVQKRLKVALQVLREHFRAWVVHPACTAFARPVVGLAHERKIDVM